MLTALAPPTSKNLMAPETVLARLGLPVEELDNLDREVAAASGLVSRYLGFEPWYSEAWEETFGDVASSLLDLGARPAWGIASIVDRAGVALAPEAYRLQRGPCGESSVVRVGMWGWWNGSRPAISTGVSPEWTVRYTAGWWLEEMPGAIPAGVEMFPAELEEDFLRIIRWRRATASVVPGVKSVSFEGLSAELFAASDQAVDPRTGIPLSCVMAMQYYGRP